MCTKYTHFNHKKKFLAKIYQLFLQHVGDMQKRMETIF